MVDVVNGGVYAVDLGGKESHEFKGVHPAIVIRTLKEEQIYVVVPLTTYTKERWDKCKRKGWGTRILSTNSIARIDKLKIVSKEFIQGRYYNTGKIVMLSAAEVEKVLRKVTEYIELSNQKTFKEYNKYIIQRNKFEKEMDILCNVDKISTFSYHFFVDNNLEVEYPLSELSFVSSTDIKTIIWNRIDNLGVYFKKMNNRLQINIELNQQNLLTYRNHYDKLNAQKGSDNA